MTGGQRHTAGCRVPPGPVRGRMALFAFLLVAVLAQFFLALVRCYLFALSLSSTGHKALLSIVFNGDS